MKVRAAALLTAPGKYETIEETEAAAQRGYGEGATVIRDIRTLNIATGKLAQAVAGRTLIEKVRQFSDDVGTPVVTEGGVPTPDTFTIADHPAFTKWMPLEAINHDTGQYEKVMHNGKVVMHPVPLRISKEFEGPLKAVLSTPTGPIYNAILGLKAKAMAVIMYSPMMHNAVIWGKAIPADPVGVLTLGAYRRGAKARNDPTAMREALNAGLDPIGKRYFNIDAASLIEGPRLEPGQSWTAQALATVPGLFNKEWSEATKRGVDAAGDVWHNKMLWDRVADLQMGLYVKIRDDAMRHGLDATTAQRMAADFGNLYAGALPIESMSKLARMSANVLMFSRSFTLGNLSSYLRISHGLPSEVQAQIERDSGPLMKARAQGEARGKAIGMLAIDVGLSFVGLTLAAGATAWLTHAAMQFPWDNEEGKQFRFLLGYQPDGTAIYGRLPSGKVGEELVDWPTDPWGMAQRKLSPQASLMLELARNDKGFGHKIYDPYDKTPLGLAKNVGRVLWRAVEHIAPEAQMQGFADMITGDSDKKTAALRTFLPFAGITVSAGAPGGPAVGDMFRIKDRFQFQFDEAKKDLQRQVVGGDVAGARAKMRELGVAPGLQNFYVKVWLNPRLRLSGRAIKDFLRTATPEEKSQFMSDRAADAARQQESQPVADQP